MPELPEAREGYKSDQRIIRVDNFNELEGFFTAKEGEPTGGTINVSVLRHCKPASDMRDAPLSEEGRTQAEELSKVINQGSRVIITYGPLPRAKETAEILAGKIQSKKVYLVEDERLNKPSWNLPERRFGEFVDKLRKRPPKNQARLLQIFYGAVGRKAMAEEPAENLESFLNDCVGLASRMTVGDCLTIVAISHIETMTPYLIRRWGLNLSGHGEWKGWRELRGIKTGSGFQLLIDCVGKALKKTLQIGGEKFDRNE